MFNYRNLTFSWKANLAVNVPIIFSMIGFLYAFILLSPKGSKNEKTYHEFVVQNKKELIAKLIDERKNVLLTKATNLESAKIGKTADSLKRDTLKKDTLKLLHKFLDRSENEFTALNYFNSDTGRGYFNQYLSVDREQYKSALFQFKDHQLSVSVPVYLKDTCCYFYKMPPVKSEKLLIVKQNMALVDWISKNGAFGLWYFISIAQMCLWFLLSVLAIGLQKVDNIPKVPNFKVGQMSIFFILPSAVILLFTWLLYWKMAGGHILEDFYFMEGYKVKMFLYSVPGYLVTIICFGCFLILSNKLELLNNYTQKNKLTIANTPGLEAAYKKIKRAFDTSFLFSTVILSVFVLWAGVLFTAVNNTEAMHYYSELSGKPFLNNDYVYLGGLFHSLLLLIFYIPVRIRFNMLELKQESDASAKNKKIFWCIVGHIKYNSCNNLPANCICGTTIYIEVT